MYRRVVKDSVFRAQLEQVTASYFLIGYPVVFVDILLRSDFESKDSLQIPHLEGLPVIWKKYYLRLQKIIGIGEEWPT